MHFFHDKATFMFVLASSKSASAAGVPLQPFQLIFQSLSWILPSPFARQFLTL